MVKKLLKSQNKVLSGVLGGIGEYMNIDPTVVRLIFILAFIFTGFIPCLLVYFIMSLIIPEAN